MWIVFNFTFFFRIITSHPASVFLDNYPLWREETPDPGAQVKSNPDVPQTKAAETDCNPDHGAELNSSLENSVYQDFRPDHGNHPNCTQDHGNHQIKLLDRENYLNNNLDFSSHTKSSQDNGNSQSNSYNHGNSQNKIQSFGNHQHNSQDNANYQNNGPENDNHKGNSEDDVNQHKDRWQNDSHQNGRETENLLQLKLLFNLMKHFHSLDIGMTADSYALSIHDLIRELGENCVKKSFSNYQTAYRNKLLQFSSRYYELLKS